ncbi:MAG: hypothetical protein AB7Y46_06995 [Armatimonadota bacterium]
MSTREAISLYAAALALALAGPACAQGANLWLFDMGSADSPLWPGFQRVTPDTAYSAEQGFGWLTPAEDLSAYLASNIDALAIDDISSPKSGVTAQFQVDLPDGEYSVWVLSGAMGNIWRLRSMRMPHELVVGDQVVASVIPPEEKLFELANYEWSAGDDIWERYIASRFQWLRAEVTAADGKLLLAFRPSIDFPVNAVVIAAREIAQRVQAQLDELDRTRRAAFYGIWQQVRPEPDPPAPVSEQERQRGYLVAEVHCSDDTHPWSQPAPEADRQRIELFATPGEQEQASFAVYGLRDLEEITFTLGPMRGEAGTLAPEAFTLGLVQYAPWHGGRHDAPAYRIQECLILPLRPTFVGEGTCKRFWITLNTPADAAPGVYRGTIEVSARNAPPASLELAVRVVPIVLQTPPFERFMYFGTMYYLGEAYLPQRDPERYWEAMRAEVRFMRDNQYCRAECIIPRGSSAVRIEDDHVVDVNLDDTARLMQILREENAWPRDNAMICRTDALNLMFGGHYSRPDNPTVEFIPTEEGRRKYAEAVSIIDRRAKAEGWPEVAFECLGEFSNYREQGRQFALEVHTLLHGLGVANTLRGNGPSDMAPIEQGLVKYPQPNHAMMNAEQLEIMRRTGERLWAYNFSRSRYSMGWFCFKMGITRASYESGVYANGQPGNLFDIETMFPMGLPTSMTTIAPTVWLKRLVQGAVDYEYLWNLDRLITEAEQSGRAEAVAKAREARAWLEGKLAELPDAVTYIAGDPKADLDVQGAFWPVHDLDRYRWQAAQFIVDLNAAMGRGR